jgi:hypothetical protein
MYAEAFTTQSALTDSAAARTDWATAPCLCPELMVGAAGLEPATLCLEGRCSIHLSYAPIMMIQSARAFPSDSVAKLSQGPHAFWI